MVKTLSTYIHGCTYVGTEEVYGNVSYIHTAHYALMHSGAVGLPILI
jgi:hypothetical protein